ncbi:hypothetical protein A2U01_0096165, partial [Trifolium medium]|nr:hypothetical protein [Trifolium medium]
MVLPTKIYDVVPVNLFNGRRENDEISGFQFNIRRIRWDPNSPIVGKRRRFDVR